MFDDLMWAFGRAGGIVAMALLTISVVTGILARSGRRAPGLTRFGLAMVHRDTSIAASAFLLLHVGTLLLDSYATLTIADVVVPFLGATNPVWLGLGTVALDLLVAVVVTGLLHRRIGDRAFRIVHWCAYAMWPAAMLHGVFDGTDGQSPWYLAGTIVGTVAVLGAAVWRLLPGFGEQRTLQTRARIELASALGRRTR